MNISTKARIRGCLRRLSDLFSRERFATGGRRTAPMTRSLTLSQPFKPSATLEGKKHNLREAASRINDVVVLPGELFSFWRTVGNPNNPRRFTYGRSLHAGVSVRDYGGGLCQASGIIHHAALLAGLEVVERHNHSVDLYTDETRFAPLGTDATVFYGYKDLRLRNTTPSAIRFELVVADDTLDLNLLSETPLASKQLDIAIDQTSDGTKRVAVRSASTGTLLSTSTYLPLQ